MKNLQKIGNAILQHAFTGWICASMIGMSFLGIKPAYSQQSVEQFYKGRQVDMIIYTANNSSYDLYARLLITHMGRFLPGNPTFIPKNMIGAGGLKAAEYLYKIAPKDGATIGTVGRGLPFDQFLGRNEMGIDFLKLAWIGSMNRESTLALAWHTSAVKTFEDLQKIELLVPGTGAGADSELIPVALNSLLGTKFKIIKGYKNTTDGALAVEREIGRAHV